MRLLMLNGSPRAAKSNTKVLLNHFGSGFLATSGNEATTLDLMRPSDRTLALDGFYHHDAVLLAFPLYTDAMPGVVKEFIELLGAREAPASRPDLLFLVQSGFPEATHTAPVARYLERLAQRLGCHCLGVMRRGNVEGIRAQPAWMTRRLLRRFHDIGEGFGSTGKLDAQQLATLPGRERIPKLMLRLVAWISRVVYWDRELKSKNAYPDRFRAPYGAGPSPARS